MDFSFPQMDVPTVDLTMPPTPAPPPVPRKPRHPKMSVDEWRPLRTTPTPMDQLPSPRKKLGRPTNASQAEQLAGLDFDQAGIRGHSVPARVKQEVKKATKTDDIKPPTGKKEEPKRMIAIPRKRKFDSAYVEAVKDIVRKMTCPDVKLPTDGSGETICVDPILTIYIAHSTS